LGPDFSPFLTQNKAVILLSTLKQNLRAIQQRIADAARRSGRRPEDVTLLAVTKTQPLEALRAAYEAGLREFGENRPQEALEKIGALPADIRWHLIGQLQTNKINKVLRRFVLIHSINSLRLAEGLSTRMVEGAQDILLEVNTSGEASKAGVSPGEALETAKQMTALPGLRLRGLMTVGPLTENPQRQRGAFQALKGLFDSIRGAGFAGENFSILSMGMSGDFEAAVEEGSTLVRVGTALFGPRA
jgi:pyridoxal phosphate enzyme (YggS family)